MSSEHTANAKDLMRRIEAERDALAKKLAVCVEMPDESIPLVKESEVWRTWLSERNEAFIVIIEKDRDIAVLSAAIEKFQAGCGWCGGTRTIAITHNNGDSQWQEPEECPRCGWSYDLSLAILAERDERMKAGGVRMEAALREVIEELDDFQDTQDGPDGKPEPNWAMVLTMKCRAALGEE